MELLDTSDGSRDVRGPEDEDEDGAYGLCRRNTPPPPLSPGRLSTSENDDAESERCMGMPDCYTELDRIATRDGVCRS